MNCRLEVEAVSTCYGALEVLHAVSLEVGEGEIVTIIGSNGAGKSTLLKTIAGWLKPRSGKVMFGEARIDGLPAHQVVRQGIAVCPEGRRVFPQLTVLENLQTGAYTRSAKEQREDLEWIFALFPRLAERRRQLGGSLSGGEQQMLALGRALMSRPKLLLLDEPSLGLAPVVVESVLDTVVEVKRKGGSILLVEQNAQMALEVADRGYVIESGRLVLSGTGRELLDHQDVKRAYLGI
ncbi:MAG: ABC transporter ATP-binding protein [Actinobacteria bacterium]|nr:ABC transporter ATP-binding protein [Actinomycetota bacterium]